ncbi:hypothetical protein [Methylobacterium planeticum]|uniref:Uncharacterized protein n=1 Tax=Methylobacterium planeticum TaxID=2615211 RepID=A0A6N6MS13_9HYPH|nr:hypothetical protein [Methylobacterium planeticum]KAB1074615.1 hypothetical protein F6X51_05640 [Methylobacterium planeticum]
MTKIQFYVPNDAFGILVSGLKQQFGEARAVVDLDYASLRHENYTLSYATDHGDKILALLDVTPSWQIPDQLQAYRRA